MIKRSCSLFVLLAALRFIVPVHAQAVADKPTAAYLFCSFRGNGEDGLHLAWSDDGLKWTAFKGDKSFLKTAVGAE
jgi:hypothetical protein